MALSKRFAYSALERPSAEYNALTADQLAACRGDRELLDRCLRNEAGAWDTLYATHHDRLLSLISRLLGLSSANAELVDEIAARVWYAVVAKDFRLLRDFDPGRGCRLSTFLGAIAKTQAANLFRGEKRRRRRERIASKWELLASQAEQCSALEAEFQDILTPREREFVEDCLTAEAAPKTPISDANRWQLGHRVRRKLRRVFRG